MTSPRTLIDDHALDSDDDRYDDEYCDPDETCVLCCASGELSLAAIHHVFAQLQANRLVLRGGVRRSRDGKLRPVFGVVPEELLD